MATHKSAEKRARQTIVREARNTAVKSRVKTAVKAFREAIAGDDKAKAGAAFMAVTRELRKAGTKNVLHKRTVSRRVSRLAQAHDAKFA